MLEIFHIILISLYLYIKSKVMKIYMKLKKFFNGEMKMFYFSKESLDYKPVRLTGLYLTISVIVFFSLLGMTTDTMPEETIPTQYEQEAEVYIIQQTDTFSVEKLVVLLKDLNILHPHIVLAQAKLESGNFTSRIFKENHNMFGMREARSRAHTALGTQYNHAYYDHWRSSVLDYALYQASYLRTLKKEEDYYKYLDASYAESGNYIKTVQGIVEREGLKQLF